MIRIEQRVDSIIVAALGGGYHQGAAGVLANEKRAISRTFRTNNNIAQPRVLHAEWFEGLGRR